jgi:ribosome-associated protein
MESVKPVINELKSEFIFTSSRSGGPGGQSVNKVNTKVTLRWDVGNSRGLTEDQRDVILKKLSKSINLVGEVVLSTDSSRSQLQNKEETVNKLKDLLNNAFKKVKPRKATKPTRSSVRKRLEDKKKHAEKKKMRKDPE